MDLPCRLPEEMVPSDDPHSTPPQVVADSRRHYRQAEPVPPQSEPNGRALQPQRPTPARTEEEDITSKVCPAVLIDIAM